MLTILGGADGPTSIYLAGTLEMGWLNLFGLILVVLLLLPNLAVALAFRGRALPYANRCANHLLRILEQVGRYACMIFMVVSLGKKGFGFSSLTAFFLYGFGSLLLLLLYWITWGLYLRKKGRYSYLALSILPTLLFFLCGVTLEHPFLICSALIFGVGHIALTWKSIQNNNFT